MNIDPFSWTGIKEKPRAKAIDALPLQKPREHERAVVAVLERPVVVETVEAPVTEPEPVYTPITYKPSPIMLSAYTPDQLKEYTEVARVVGVSPADLHVEEFKSFLIANEMTVFDLATVVKFMDEKSQAEGHGWGWNWKPLRQKDRINAWFGRAADHGDRFGVMWNGRSSPATPPKPVAASDHYSQQNEIYTQVVPLHALKKVAHIETNFPHQVAFMVSDYAPAPAFRADPFLMAVIPNSGLRGGAGRYVIDVWDEPGFGIEHMLKSGL